MYIASSQTNHQEICTEHLQWVCDRKLEGVAAEHLAGQLRSQPRSMAAQGSSLQGLAPRRRLPATMHRMEGKTWQKTKEREKNEGKPKHFNDDSC